jgi:hypothetical protein
MDGELDDVECSDAEDDDSIRVPADLLLFVSNFQNTKARDSGLSVVPGCALMARRPRWES